MDQLSQELICHICSYLGRKDLASTLTLNEYFQIASKESSGRFKSVYLTEKCAKKFLDMYSGHRFRMLKKLTILPTLPSRDWSARPSSPLSLHLKRRYEHQNDRAVELWYRRVDLRFTRQINFLFSVLKALERCVNNRYGLLPKIRLVIDEPAHKRDGRWSYRELVSRRLNLLSPEELPELESIQVLQFDLACRAHDFTAKEAPHSLRMIDLRAILNISAKLPNLKQMIFSGHSQDFQTPPVEHDHLSSRETRLRSIPQQLVPMFIDHLRASRHQFSRAVASGVSFPELEEVRWEFMSPDILKIVNSNEFRSPANLSAPLTYDPFSNSIRILSYGLRRMNLVAVIDETLFWPVDASVPHWPKPETLVVEFRNAGPSGTWYFKRCRHLPKRTPMETLRIVPNFDRLGPILTAFVRATHHMPALKEVAIWCTLTMSETSMKRQDGKVIPHLPIIPRYHLVMKTLRPDVRPYSSHERFWGLVYNTPGAASFLGEEICSDTVSSDYMNSRKIWWYVGPHLPTALQETFENIGPRPDDSELKQYRNEWEPYRSNYGGNETDSESGNEYEDDNESVSDYDDGYDIVEGFVDERNGYDSREDYSLIDYRDELFPEEAQL